MCQNSIFYATAVVDAFIRMGLVCVLEPRVCVWLFFFYQRLVHCSCDINSASRQMNSNRNIFFYCFNFQQNKWYPNAHLVFVCFNF